MKRRFSKVLIGVLAIALVFLFVSIAATPNEVFAAASVLKLEPIKTYDGDVYAIKEFCISGWKKAPKDSDSFCIKGDYKYYTVTNGTSGYISKLYRCNLDGSGKKLLSENADPEGIIVKNKIYFDAALNDDFTDTGIYVIDLDTLKKSKFVGGNTLIDSDGTYIYSYNDKGNIYRTKLDGTGHKRISNVKGYGYILDGSYIYGSISNIKNDTESIFRIKKDGSGIKKTLKTISGGYVVLNVHKGYIYYGTDKGVFRLKTNGTSTKKLTSLPSGSLFATPIKVIDDYLYVLCLKDTSPYNCFFYKLPIKGGTLKYLDKKFFVS